MELKQGYSDGSGQEHILMGEEPVLALRWGCKCCQDTSPLTDKEKQFAQHIVKCCNNYDRMVEVNRIRKEQLNYVHHHEDCAMAPVDSTDDCDCGLNELVSKIIKAEQAPNLK